MVHKLGYGNWDELKAVFRTSPLFRFDWFVKSRTTQELARRCDTLIRLVEKENQEFDERERQARKEKKLAKVLPSSFLLAMYHEKFLSTPGSAMPRMDVGPTMVTVHGPYFYVSGSMVHLEYSKISHAPLLLAPVFLHTWSDDLCCLLLYFMVYMWSAAFIHLCW